MGHNRTHAPQQRSRLLELDRTLSRSNCIESTISFVVTMALA